MKYYYHDKNIGYVLDDNLLFNNEKKYYVRSQSLKREKVLIRDIIKNVVHIYGKIPL